MIFFFFFFIFFVVTVVLTCRSFLICLFVCLWVRSFGYSLSFFFLFLFLFLFSLFSYPFETKIGQKPLPHFAIFLSLPILPIILPFYYSFLPPTRQNDFYPRVTITYGVLARSLTWYSCCRSTVHHNRFRELDVTFLTLSLSLFLSLSLSISLSLSFSVSLSFSPSLSFAFQGSFLPPSLPPKRREKGSSRKREKGGGRKKMR